MASGISNLCVNPLSHSGLGGKAGLWPDDEVQSISMISELFMKVKANITDYVLQRSAI